MKGDERLTVMKAGAEMQREKELGKAYDMRLLRWLMRYVRPYKTHAIFAFVLMLLSAPVGLVGPPLTKAAVDLFIAPDASHPPTGFSLFIKQASERLGFGENAHQGLLFITLIFLSAHLIVILLQYAQAMLLQTMGQRIMFDLRREIFAHLQKLPIRFFDRHPIGRLMTRATTDIESLNELFTTGVVVILSDIIIASYIMCYMFKVNWRLALVSFSILPLLIALTIWFRRGARRAFREIRERVAQINAFLQEHITGMAVVQMFNREGAEMRRFERINESHREANTRAVFFYAVFYPAIDIIGAIGIALIIWYGGGQVVGDVTTIGTLIAFIQLTQAFYVPVTDISERYNTLQSAMASSERLLALLEEPVADAEALAAGRQLTAIESPRGHIEFRNVWFAYEGDDWVLKNVSFIIEPGQRVALVGHTGAGKSTIAGLLLRFYEIQKGRILLDGVDISELDVSQLRSYFSIVQQDTFLFSGDIASNIRLGHSDISDERLRAAACAVHADKFISKLPEGYATQLNERGAGLSVGQKQLISFARAMAFDPRILVLDEATSSIDAETELLIKDAIESLMQGRTSLIIAHRLATVQNADKIIVLHLGEVHEEDTHHRLLQRRGLYWRLHQLQSQENLKCLV